MNAVGILDFWFGSHDEPRFQTFWFEGSAEIDHVIQREFKTIFEASLQHHCDAWVKHSKGSLALILLWDQFPRHFFRNDPRMFATDARALELAQGSLEKGYDRHLPEVMRLFMYMPFQHSEDLKHQKQSVELYRTLNNEVAYDYALMHLRTIETFGRFPHRNALLGRVNTFEEETFLKNPPAGFFSGR